VYQGYWYDFRPKQLDKEGAQKLLKAAPSTARADLKIQRLVALLGALKGKLVLDVGAGTGEFLLAARHAGADVIANEVSAEACDFLQRVLQIPVVRGELVEAPWEFGQPDVIVMSDLIEHPIEPLRLLSRACALLKRGGQLVIWTPNGGGAGTETTTAESWVGFRVDLEHLQYFSAKTVQLLSGSLGLDIDHLETTGYPALSRIDQLPMTRDRDGVGRLVKMCKTLIKRIAPWLPMIVQIARELRTPRTRGTYHLFAVLTKP
jgi:SAM-dependent methyltransferase